MADRKDVVQGTLDLLVLRIIATQPMHGWGVMQRLRHLTEDVFQVTPGSLFPALRRLEENGWASGYWDLSENNRKARYYEITKAGQKQLAREKQHWKSITRPSRRSWREHETPVVSPAGRVAPVCGRRREGRRSSVRSSARSSSTTPNRRSGRA